MALVQGSLVNGGGAVTSGAALFDHAEAESTVAGGGRVVTGLLLVHPEIAEVDGGGTIAAQGHRIALSGLDTLIGLPFPMFSAHTPGSVVAGAGGANVSYTTAVNDSVVDGGGEILTQGERPGHAESLIDGGGDIVTTGVRVARGASSVTGGGEVTTTFRPSRRSDMPTTLRLAPNATQLVLDPNDTELSFDG